MKRLILVRHAKSSWSDADLADFDRPLNERGKKDAPRMGKRLKERSTHPDIMLTSPAVRALHTCQVIAEVLDFPLAKIKTDRDLYHASDDQLLRVISRLPETSDKEQIVMLFGHNPGLTEFAERLLNETFDNIPTCGVVSAVLQVEKWKDVFWGCGKKEYFDFPKNKQD